MTVRPEPPPSRETSSGSAPLLAVRAVTRRFPGVLALDRVDLDVHAGEVHVLLGENGAGKSTLMKVLSGAVRKDAGDVLVDGHPVDIRSPHRARALGISIVYQELNLAPHLTVADNIFLGKFPRRWPWVVDRRRMEEESARLLAGLGVPLDVRMPVNALGLAEQQMVEIARALSDSARVVIMDEPTSALTAREVEQLFAAIARLTAAGVAVIYISHRMDEIFRVGHRVTVLRDGRNVGTRPVAGASVAELVRLMADRDVADHFPRRQVPRGEAVLEVEALSTRGGLRDVSLVLHRGEVLGLAGLVGAGRTELARALFGAASLRAGRVRVKGTPVAIRTPRRAVALGIGFLPEDRKLHGLVPRLSIRRNVSLPILSRLSRWGFVDDAAERAVARRWCDRLRVKAHGVEDAALTLSGGNQQKVVLAKWLAAEADVLLFDEPTRGIDLAARRDIYDLVNELVGNGAAVLMISSELPEVIAMSDRVLVMRGGAICGEFEGGAGVTEAQVLHAALGLAS